MKDLFERGVAARKEVEEATREVADAQADLAGARAAAQAAETMAARSVVHATFDGIVSRRSHNPGDLVGASDAVLRIVDPARLELVAQIPLADAPRIRMGAPARVAAATGTPGAALAVASRPAAVQEGTATIPVRLAFKQPAGYAVGTPLEVEIDGETHRQVVLVPTAAVVHEGDESAVFVVNADKAQRRVVMTGASDADHVEITQGIKAGETVIVTNQNGLPDGATVSVEQR
jgi:RND family efflux transporter MFP subunit